MSLRQEILALIEEARTPVDVDDLMPDLPEYTRDKVMASLCNLKLYGLITVITPGLAAKYPAKYGPIAKAPPTEPPVNSVFQLGDRAAQRATLVDWLHA